ncbi:P2X purinoceptor 4-like isoform X1 [Littorina saxatilis]|uniref:ATP receptor n=1 Tax=Littorina saxatilis TaxID=31220 RepID=A0AAN9AJN4_9CAEN
MPQPKALVRSAIGVFFEYDTPRIVHIRSKKVGIINRLIQITILAYLIGYVIVWRKGYQQFDNVQSAVTTKVKGVVFTNFTGIPGLDGRVWDVSDYVVPPQENGAFFVMTNVLVTPTQTQGTCDEDPTVADARCENKTCTRGEPVNLGNGIKTGNCIDSTVDPGAKVCEIYAWCPVERADNTTQAPTPALLGSENFTVFIKNNIEFPKFDVLRRNILGFDNDTELSSCRFDPNDARYKLCPIFGLSQIVQLAGTNYSDIAKGGGVIQVIINWDCNLDLDVSECLPEYSFRRLDRGDFSISRGFNFRYADHYKLENGTGQRTLYKAWGIRFLVSVQGQAGKFFIIPLLLNFGSGIALLSIATVICDIVVLYLLKARSYYKDKKYLDVKGEDAYEVMDDRHDDDSDGPRQRRNAGNGEDNS